MSRDPEPKNRYSHYRWWWAHIPHRHYYTATIKGFTWADPADGGYEEIHGYQCLRCWRDPNAPAFSVIGGKE